MKTSKIKNISGKRFGRLLVLNNHRVENPAPGQAYTFWLCRCDCGTEKWIMARNLKAGTTGSCGCYRREANLAKGIHGHASHTEGLSPTYITWRGMLKRHKERGIPLCQHWLKFENFLADMGERPEGKTIDRKDGKKGYMPENCRWATYQEQAENRKTTKWITYQNRTQTLLAWARELGFTRTILHSRMRRGMTFEEAIKLR